MKCFHTTDEFKRGPFLSGPKPAVGVKHVTPASLAHVRVGALKEAGPNEDDLEILWLEKDHFPADLTLRGHELPGHMPSQLCPSATPSHERPSLAVAPPTGKRLDPSWQESPSKRPGWQLGSSHRLQMAPEPWFCLGPARYCPRWEAPRSPVPAHVDEKAAESAGENSRQTGRSTNEAAIWPEFELGNIFTWIQFVVKLSQSVCISDAAAFKLAGTQFLIISYLCVTHAPFS